MGKAASDATTFEEVSLLQLDVLIYTATLVERHYQGNIFQTGKFPRIPIFDKTSVMATESDAVLKQVFRDFINGCHILHYHRYVSYEQTNNRFRFCYSSLF